MSPKLIWLNDKTWETIDTPAAIFQKEPGRTYQPICYVTQVRERSIYAYCVFGMAGMWFPMSALRQNKIGRLFASTWAIQSGMKRHVHYLIRHKGRSKMFNKRRVLEIVQECTAPYRKGDVVHGDPGLVQAIMEGRDDLPGGTVSIDLYPAATELPTGFRGVDTHFILVGVDTTKAEARKAELQDILRFWPENRLMNGPSYLEVGSELESQEMAFRLFALGDVLDMWKIITPKLFGFEGVEAEEMAGAGMIFVSGFKYDYATADKNPCL